MMQTNRCTLLFLLMLMLGAAVRLNNALTFPSLRAFDGFGHFTYIWFMADHWRVPLPTAGWSFFHPPLYYALMALIWRLLEPLDPVLRLNVGTSLIALVSLTHAVAIFVIVRRYLPERHLVHLLAAGLMLFLPAHLYSAGFLGNENLNAALCSLALLMLLWVLRQPSSQRAALLGVLLGAGMLTKFTSLAIVAGALVTLGLQTWVRGSWRKGLATLAVTCTALLLVCGWYYARNISLYGTPFKVSRDEFMVRHVENFQSKGLRNVWEYVLFDPLILRRPQWPRGVPLTGELPADFPHSALRESVLTGVYANAWFDAVGGMVLPPVTTSEVSRRAGQLLLTLGLVPSLLVVLGIATAIQRLWRKGWDDTLVAMLLSFTAMVGLFVQATTVVPMHAAVKATYLTPVSLIFGFWFALGVDRLEIAKPRWFRGAAMICLLAAVSSVVTFSHDRFIARHWLAEASAKSPTWQNLYGIVYYAGGDRRRARQLFESAAQGNWHLAYENLAYLALEDGRPLEALYHLRNAAQKQPAQSFGIAEDRLRFDRATQADYQNQTALIYYRLGWLDLAVAAAEKAYELDATIPETRYDLAVLRLTRVLAKNDRGDVGLRRAIAQSRVLLLGAAARDPAFFAVRALMGTLEALEGNCTLGTAMIREALSPHPGMYRSYPATTGPGDMHTAALRRRRYLVDLPEPLRPEYQLARCAMEAARDHPLRRRCSGARGHTLSAATGSPTVRHRRSARPTVPG